LGRTREIFGALSEDLLGGNGKAEDAKPQGAASLSLAVLESDGRKREMAIGHSAGVGAGRRG
jgi:hypothetical protein